MIRPALLSCALVLASTLASAQDVPDPAADARIHLGPLALTPKLDLVNAGIDTNVFNEPTPDGPKRDFTVTFEPKTDWWLRMGRTWLLGNVTEGLVYYEKYDSERSINQSYKAGWLVPLTRISMQVDGNYLHTRDRPGFEIDSRPERSDYGAAGSVEARLLATTLMGVKARWQHVDYDKDAMFQGRNLHDELNRTVTEGAVTIRQEITPLTSLTLDIGREQDRFQFSPLRDSDSTRIVGGIRFDPSALLKGTATFGYRNFQPLGAGVPSYKGTTATIDLSYVALAATRFSVKGLRDVQYSYDVNQPYYLQTGITGEVMQRLFGPIDIAGRAGIARLEYRDRAGADVPVADQLDTVHLYGGGVGYHVGRDTRIGFNIDQQKRESQVALRQYKGLRFGTSVTYGF